MDTLLGPLAVLGSALLPAAAAPLETQDPTSEVITAEWVFDGSDGSFYNGTIGTPLGAQLGVVNRSIMLGRGWWGNASVFDRIRMAYPGNLTLSPSLSANEVFYGRSAAGPRDRNAAGVTQWTAAAPSNSIHVMAFDQDGDGWLDDAVLAYTGNQNRIYTFNQGGTQMGTRAQAPNLPLNDIAAVDTDSNGILDQIAVAHEGGLVYVDRALATSILNVWTYTVAGNAPVKFVAGADFNNDSFLDNVVAGTDDGTVYALNGTGSLKWTYSTGGSSIVNLTSLVTPGTHALNGVLVGATDAITLLDWSGQVVWNWTTNGTVTALGRADYDHDGLFEGVFFADDTGAFSYLSGSGTLLAWGDFFSDNATSATAIDFDGDGWLDEVVAANGTTVVGIDASAQFLWSYTVGAAFRVNMLAAADFDGNGTLGDTLVPTSDTLYVLNRTGALRWSASEARNLASAAFIENPSAASAGNWTSEELDAGGTAGWASLAFNSSVNSPNERLAAWIRYGSGTPGNVSWSSWSGNFSGPLATLTGNSSRFAQVRFEFASLDGVNSANLSSMALNYTVPADVGSITTLPLTPPPTPLWLDTAADFDPSTGAVLFSYSATNGSTWNAFNPGDFIDGANQTALSLRFRVDLVAGGGAPVARSLSVRYTQPSLNPTILTPSANASITGTFTLSSAAAPQIVSVRFSYFDPASNATVDLGAAVWNASSLKWELPWNTTALNLSGITLIARGTDARGFTFTSSIVGVVIDNEAPFVSIQDPRPLDNLTAIETLTATASADAVSVSFSYFNGFVTNVIGNATQGPPGVWSLVWDTSAIGEREGGSIFASVVDGVGLLGSDTVLPITIDNIAPWVRVDWPIPPANLTGDVSAYFNASSDVVRLEILVDNVSGGFATFLGIVNGTSRWALLWNTRSIYYNPNATLRAQATDRVNLTGTNSTGPFEINNTGLEIEILQPSQNSFNGGVVHVSASAPLTTVRLDFYYIPEGSTRQFIRSLTDAQRNATTGLWEFDWETRSPFIEFSGSIYVEATSQFNTTGNATVDGVVVDNTDPYVEFFAPRIGDNRLTGVYSVLVTTLDVYGVAGVTLSYTNQQDGALTIVGPMLFAGGTWRYDWDLTSAYFPSVTLHAAAQDFAGHTGTADFADLTLGVNTSDNLPQFLRDPPSLTLPEDFGTYTINVSGLVTDDDMANLTAYLDNVNPAVVTLRSNGSKGGDPIYLISVPDAYSAQTDIRLRVVDSGGQSASRSFTFQVLEVNDPPVWLDPPPKIWVRYDVDYELNFSQYIHDVEFEKEGKPVTITTEDPHISANATAPTSLIFRYGESLLGQTFLVGFSLSDMDPNLAPATTTIQVVVTSDWVPQVTGSLPVVLLDEDTPRSFVFNLSHYFVDNDVGDTLFYYRGRTNLTFEITPEGEVSVLALPRDWFGIQTVSFGANDPTGAFSETRATFVVASVNDAPRWAPPTDLDISTLRVRFDEPFAFDLFPYITDVDSPVENLQMISSSPYVRAAPGLPLTLLVNFPANFTGSTVPVTVWFSDGAPVNSTSQGKLFSMVVSSNYPPKLAQPLPKEIVMYEGDTRRDALNLSQYFTDRDGVLYFVFGLVNINATVDAATGLVTLSSTGEWSGSEILLIRAVDNEAAFQQGSILITVLPVDDTPRLSLIRDIELEYSRIGHLDLSLYANDVDSNLSKLTYSASSKFPGVFITISGSNLTLFYQWYEGAPAFDTISVCVSDTNTTNCQRTIAIHLVQSPQSSFDLLRFFFFMGAVGVASIVVARHFFEFKVKRPPTIEDIFLVYEDGILIKHYSKKVRKYADDDVVTSMLSAIQSFAADSFEDRENWELREIDFQGRRILIERARKFQIFVIFDGDSTDGMKRTVRQAAQAIEREYGKYLRDWDGDPSHFNGAEKFFSDLLAMEAAFIPSEVSADELRKSAISPGSVFVSQTGDFDPLIRAYLKDVEGCPVIRIRPAGDAGSSLGPLKPVEIQVIEVPAPEGIPGDDESGETELDVTLRKLAEAVERARYAATGRPALILFEGFDFIVDRYGFVFSKKFADHLKKMANREGFYLFIAVKPDALSSAQLEGLERETVVFRGG